MDLEEEGQDQEDQEQEEGAPKEVFGSAPRIEGETSIVVVYLAVYLVEALGQYEKEDEEEDVDLDLEQDQDVDAGLAEVVADAVQDLDQGQDAEVGEEGERVVAVKMGLFILSLFLFQLVHLSSMLEVFVSLKRIIPYFKNPHGKSDERKYRTGRIIRVRVAKIPLFYVADVPKTYPK